MTPPLKHFALTTLLLSCTQAVQAGDKVTNTSETFVSQADARYTLLVSELIHATEDEHQLLRWAPESFSDIKVKNSTSRSLSNEFIKSQKHYAACALDTKFKLSYDIEVSWTTPDPQQHKPKHDMKEDWVLTSYKVKKRNAPCRA